ncbi:hypothetical protein TIFTF001_021777 [Ficus carica]|uniref:Uncharacterized protein n=1 Tax=Ficus carica TaxID=3494 RepID=A0AA88DDX1_FICCA|nr:hypothetical protein TIFTF001_021777 [Ficus carica]
MLGIAMALEVFLLPPDFALFVDLIARFHSQSSPNKVEKSLPMFGLKCLGGHALQRGDGCRVMDRYHVPNGIGNKATLMPTATKSPPPQVKLVLVVHNILLNSHENSGGSGATSQDARFWALLKKMKEERNCKPDIVDYSTAIDGSS